MANEQEDGDEEVQLDEEAVAALRIPMYGSYQAKLTQFFTSGDPL